MNAIMALCWRDLPEARALLGVASERAIAVQPLPAPTNACCRSTSCGARAPSGARGDKIGCSRQLRVRAREANLRLEVLAAAACRVAFARRAVFSFRMSTDAHVHGELLPMTVSQQYWCQAVAPYMSPIG